MNLNYTFADSSVTVFGRTDDLPFFRQSDRVYSWNLFAGVDWRF